jgi:paraquat-inducible protein B
VRKPGPTAIGLFVLGAMALIVAGVFFFGGSSLLASRLPAVSYFHGSVAGLQMGAAVTYRGVEVGQVKSIGIRLDPKTFRSIIQVDMELVPDAVKVHGGDLPADETLVPKLVQRGLTAQLVKQSFVTGLLTVDLDFRPEVSEQRTVETNAPIEIPTVPTDFERLARRARDFDLPGAVETLQSTLASLDRLLKAPEVMQTVAELPLLVIQLRQTLKGVDSEVAGLSGSVRESLSGSAGSLQKTLDAVQRLSTTLEREAVSTASAARGTLQKADTTLAGLNTAVGAIPSTLQATNRALEGVNRTLDPNSRTMTQLQRAVDDLAATAARLRTLVERADRDPSILIRGR